MLFYDKITISFLTLVVLFSTFALFIYFISFQARSTKPFPDRSRRTRRRETQTLRGRADQTSRSRVRRRRLERRRGQGLLLANGPRVDQPLAFRQASLSHGRRLRIGSRRLFGPWGRYV